MADEKKFLVDVGMRDLPFPMKVISRVEPEGQSTVANIAIHARLMQEFEARWIDRFIQIVHQHRDYIGTRTLRRNILDYLEALKAATVRIDFDYPFFVEKRTPATRERCLVRYLCTYSAKASSLEPEARAVFKIQIPCITTYPVSDPADPGGLFGQLSVIDIEVEAKQDIYPEDLVELVDAHALAPVYSFLEEEDQIALIHRIHSQKKTSVVVVDEIKGELARDRKIDWYAVRSANYGMLHSYSTVIGTEKSSWIPFSGYEGEV
jgi:GTP cyclohydrolase IB